LAFDIHAERGAENADILRMPAMNFLPRTCALCALAALVAGCGRGTHANNNNPAPTPQQVQAARQEQASDRELLEQIPPPGKSQYTGIHTRDGWENPFVVVSAKTVSLRVMNPAPPKSDMLPGTLLQPVSARKHVLDLRLADLPEALASLPETAWPYGRVVAVEEDPAEVRANRVPIRRNLEATIQELNDLGVVVYEWPGLR
jgi:hypothetical protein